MFKRNLSDDAFDAISFNKKETSVMPKINFLKDHEDILRYGLVGLSGLFFLFLLMGTWIYFEYKDDMKITSRVIELHKIQISEIKKELKDLSLIKPPNKSEDEQPNPIINYWGSIKAKGKVKALVEINGTRQLVAIGHLFDSGWHLSQMFDEFLVIESQSGISLQINREESAQ